MGVMFRPRGWPKRIADWRGMHVRTTTELANGYGVMREGTRCTIRRGQGGGLWLDGPECEHCGVALSR